MVGDIETILHLPVASQGCSRRYGVHAQSVAQLIGLHDQLHVCVTYEGGKMRHCLKFRHGCACFTAFAHYFFAADVTAHAAVFFRQVGFFVGIGVQLSGSVKMGFAEIVSRHHAARVHKVVNGAGAETGKAMFSHEYG